MATHQKQKEAFVHVIGTVLDFKSDLPMMKAMGELEYDPIKDIVIMDKEEETKLSYTVKVTKGDKEAEVTKDVPLKLKKKILHVMWWCDHEVLLRASKLLTTEDWLKLTGDEFDIFVDTIAANMARTVAKTDLDETSTVTVTQVNDFQRGHRRHLTIFKQFNGDRRMWFMCKRNWHSNAINDGIKHLMENYYNVPLDGMEARQ
eukprot:12635690-Ditylum_brightwellii.AAC.1